jgi:hypothetical protein
MVLVRKRRARLETTARSRPLARHAWARDRIPARRAIAVTVVHT